MVLAGHDHVVQKQQDELVAVTEEEHDLVPVCVVRRIVFLKVWDYFINGKLVQWFSIEELGANYQNEKCSVYAELLEEALPLVLVL